MSAPAPALDSTLEPAQGPRLPSLRARLVRHVLWPLALMWLAGTLVTVGVAYYYAQQAFDRALLDDAQALAARVKLGPDGLALELSSYEISSVLFDQSESVYFAVLRGDGSLLAGHPGLQASGPSGAARSRLSYTGYQGKNLRAVRLLRQLPAPFEVVVAQTLGSRTELLRSVLMYSVGPELVLLLGLAWWLRRAIGADLRPLMALQRAINQRDAQDLTALPLSASSSDLTRLGQAINALLARVNHSVRAQREFSGNVAHELRTPLAGIRALAEYGLAHRESAVWREQLQRIVASEARASRLVEQLLALALAEEADMTVPTQAVALDELVRETVLRYLPRADAVKVDLGVQGLDTEPDLLARLEPAQAQAHAPGWQVLGNAALIEGVLGNLLDNALRYGRALDGQSSHVTVALTRVGEAVQLSVLDNGAGLNPQQRLHLLQRGVRGAAAELRAERLGEGAGLGLAIVAKFAQVMGAGFELGEVTSGPGLRATVRFKRARASL